jgi:hypothetical protein
MSTLGAARTYVASRHPFFQKPPFVNAHSSAKNEVFVDSFRFCEVLAKPLLGGSNISLSCRLLSGVS